MPCQGYLWVKGNSELLFLWRNRHLLHILLHVHVSTIIEKHTPLTVNLLYACLFKYYVSRCSFWMAEYIVIKVFKVLSILLKNIWVSDIMNLNYLNLKLF